ncbi:MAG: RNA polymerase sigma factor [Elusimicrobiota bacterium]
MTPDPREDHDVVRAVLAGDRGAFAALVRSHQDKVLFLCRSLLRNDAEAEDAAQDIFVRAYRRLSDFRFQSAFSTWLYRISYHRCLDVLKSRAARRAQSLDALLESGGEAALRRPPEPAAPPGAEGVRSVLESLPPDYRLVLTLREAQGLSYEEISAATGDSLDSVKARLRRARAALREKARHFPELSGV